LNLVMLISIPFAGHHYVIDMVAIVAAIAIGIVKLANLGAPSTSTATEIRIWRIADR
jgi:hypothetical protein